MTTSRLRTVSSRLRAVSAALLATGLLVGGCSSPTGDGERDGSGDVTAPGEEEASVFEVQVGDCLVFPDDATTLRSLTGVPCEELHDAEAYHELALEGETYPGDAEVAAAAEQACVTAFEAFIGVPYEASSLEFDYLAPSRESWDSIGDRVVSCLVFDPANLESVGTLAGAAR